MADNTELMTIDDICNRVYVIRGQQVMLDYDLAEIYGYEVKALNQQVKRNIDRFPEDFMFQLKKEEVPKEFCEYFEIPYMTETDWELGNRKMPQYLLRLMAYKIKIEKLADKRNKDDKEDNVSDK